MLVATRKRLVNKGKIDRRFCPQPERATRAFFVFLSASGESVFCKKAFSHFNKRVFKFENQCTSSVRCLINQSMYIYIYIYNLEYTKVIQSE